MERVGKIVVRRSGTDVSFVSVFEPIRGQSLVERILELPGQPLRIVCSTGRVDTLDLAGGEAGYAWRSVTNGTETAQACLKPEANSAKGK